MVLVLSLSLSLARLCFVPDKCRPLFRVRFYYFLFSFWIMHNLSRLAVCVCEKQTFITLIDRPKYIYFATNGNGRVLMKKNEKRDGQRCLVWHTQKKTESKIRLRRNGGAHTAHAKRAHNNLALLTYRQYEECERWQWMAIHMIWLIRRHSGLLLWIRCAKQPMAMLVNSTHSDSKRKKNISCLMLINMILWTGTHATNDKLMCFFLFTKKFILWDTLL